MMDADLSPHCRRPSPLLLPLVPLTSAGLGTGFGSVLATGNFLLTALRAWVYKFSVNDKAIEKVAKILSSKYVKLKAIDPGLSKNKLGLLLVCEPCGDEVLVVRIDKPKRGQ